MEIIEKNIGPTDKFIDMTRPLMKSTTEDLMTAAALLSLRQAGTYGIQSEIIKLQEKEIINEIALRN